MIKLHNPCRFILTLITLLLSACGGGGGGGSGTTNTNTNTVITTEISPATSSSSTGITGANAIPVSVDSALYNVLNVPYVSITLCSPNAPATCQTIDHILLDTGSTGLRIISGVLNSALNLPAQGTTNSGGNPIAECAQFATGYTWGPIKWANLQLAGNTVKNIAIQIIGDTSYATTPYDCSGSGGEMNSVQTLGANGILGIGLFKQDCGQNCTIQANQMNTYFSCLNKVCSNIAQTLNDQLQNPVSLFSQDNNGIIIAMNAVSPVQATATGTLIFGVDTEANNVSSNINTVTTDTTLGYFSTAFNGHTYPDSFLDTGSNALFFDSSALPQCARTGAMAAPGFYCPASLQVFSAIATGANNLLHSTINFSVDNAATLFNNNPVSDTVFVNVAGPMNDGGTSFDWGLPFFYGKSVYVVIEGQTTTMATGPYFGW